MSSPSASTASLISTNNALHPHSNQSSSSPSASTASLMSNNTVSSRAPLNGSRTTQPKDFQAAFASLQSTYGFSGSAPSPVPKKNAKSTSAPRSAVPPSVTRTPLQAGNKNFEAAFADLQSTYGFGGAAPSPVPKSKK
ncbi:hypothetical protein MSAN_00732100 [Mycena sanguinolenta]|uniref:Uncharacterized protein n=1 Tax=Mycena sanguinolenta TaxID=230812 RepID=A0A8H6Z4U9_9AGAR|nr:hypothetical protein MSAN_00732100 [Mycena sanguinolenta]